MNKTLGGNWNEPTENPANYGNPPGWINKRRYGNLSIGGNNIDISQIKLGNPNADVTNPSTWQQPNSGKGKYITTKQTNVLRWDTTGKKDIMGDTASNIVKTLPPGKIIDIEKTGGGGRGVVMTPYLIFANGDFIIAYDAKPYNENDNGNLKVAMEPFKNKPNLFFIALISGGTAALAYFVPSFRNPFYLLGTAAGIYVTGEFLSGQNETIDAIIHAG